jgi:surface protein
MFQHAKSFNQNLSRWDTSNVLNMGEMFCICISFNQNLSQWNTSSVQRMQRMFEGATAFNQDVSSWGSGWDVTRFEVA